MQVHVSFCKKRPAHLPEWLRHLAFPLAVSESSWHPAFSPAFGISVLDLGHSERCALLCHFDLRFPDDI